MSSSNPVSLDRNAKDRLSKSQTPGRICQDTYLDIGWHRFVAADTDVDDLELLEDKVWSMFLGSFAFEVEEDKIGVASPWASGGLRYRYSA